jgi:hypothetical protein
MIVGRGGTTAVSNLPTSHGLAGAAGPQRTIKERGNPRAAPRGRRVAPAGPQTATVLGGPGGVRGVDPVAVPSLSTGTVNFTLIMIYFAKANTGCRPFDEARPPHFVFALAK